MCAWFVPVSVDPASGRLDAGGEVPFFNTVGALVLFRSLMGRSMRDLVRAARR